MGPRTLLLLQLLALASLPSLSVDLPEKLPPKGGLVATPDNLEKLRQEGLGDLDGFMGSFEAGQQIADDVKCALCRSLLGDMQLAGAPLWQAKSATGKRDAELAATTEANIHGLCDQQVPRFLALYTIRDCEKEQTTAACRAIARPRRYAIERDAELEPEEALARTAAPERQWQADAHTVMCGKYWSPLAEDMGEAVLEAVLEGEGTAEMAQRFCLDNAICREEKTKKKKKAKKKEKKAKKKAKAKKDKGSEGAGSPGVMDDVARKVEQIKRARESGASAGDLREQMWEDELEQKLAAARKRSAARKAKAAGG